MAGAPILTSPTPATARGPAPLAGVRRIIAVASGKGGVGKTTLSVNLSLALADAGFRVGLVDADLFGPSIPGMLGLPADAKPTVSRDQKVIPVEAQGLKVMSMAMLTGDDAPAVMRGPMVTKYLQLFIGDVAWGGLDYLILDLPPGTGDTQLTLAQNFPLTGAVIVTTPQDVSLKIARRGARMFEQVKVPLLGVVENMSGFCCPNCGTVTDIFRKGGGERLAEALGAPFLGAVPLDAAVVDCGDDGTPLVRAWPDSAAAAAYRSIAARLADTADPGARLPSPFVWPWEEGAGVRADGAAPQANGRPAQPLALERRDSRTLGILWADGARQEHRRARPAPRLPLRGVCGRNERPPPARPCDRAVEHRADSGMGGRQLCDRRRLHRRPQHRHLQLRAAARDGGGRDRACLTRRRCRRRARPSASASPPRP